MSQDDSRARKRRKVRIDSAHAAARAPENRSATPVPETVAVASDAARLSQVRNQASQLATHLHAMREDLDHREKELNTRVATVDNDMRSARLWLQEREHELTERIAAVEQRETQVDTATGELDRAAAHAVPNASASSTLPSKVEQAVQTLGAKRSNDEAELRQRGQRIDVRQRAVEALAEQLLDGLERHRLKVEEACRREEAQVRSAHKTAFQKDYQQAAEELESRQRYLDDAEALLINSQADLEVQQKQLEIQRKRARDEHRQQRKAVAERQRQLELEWQDRQAALARRSEQMDLRHNALEHARGEVAGTHREALELRLATEELWAKLSEVMPAPALTAKLGKLRRKLAESYSLERNATVKEQQRLEASHTQLTEQYLALNGEKKELHDWVERRQREIEQQAARLVAREQQLDRQEGDNRKRADEWQQQQRRYQSRIRDLVTELRRGPSANTHRAALPGTTAVVHG